MIVRRIGSRRGGRGAGRRRRRDGRGTGRWRRRTGKDAPRRRGGETQV